MDRRKKRTSGGLSDEIVFKWSGARNDDRRDDDDNDPVESLTLLYGDHCTERLPEVMNW